MNVNAIGRPRRRAFGLSAFAVFVVSLFALTSLAAASQTLLQINSDPYTNTTSQHKTEVEPDTFAAGSTIVSAFQVGRFFNGGATNIGWVRSADGGSTWSKGFLPGITTAAGGSYG